MTLGSLSEIKSILNDREVFIFDFDGVLADSVDIKTQAFKALFSEYDESIQSEVASYHENNKGVSRFAKLEYYHRHLLKESLDDEFITSRAQQFSELVVTKVVAAAEIPGAENFLKTWAGNRRCFVVSATPEEEIINIVQQRGWRQYFVDIYGSPDNKKANIERMFETYSITPNQCVFFGDASADCQAANSVGCKFIAVNYPEYDSLSIPDFLPLL